MKLQHANVKLKSPHHWRALPETAPRLAEK
jgi:hypothetical protein